MNQHRLELKNAQEARERERELAKEIQEGDIDDDDAGLHEMIIRQRRRLKPPLLRSRPGRRGCFESHRFAVAKDLQLDGFAGGRGGQPSTQENRLTRGTKSEMEPLSDLLAALSAEAEWLADREDARFMSEVALRLQQSED